MPIRPINLKPITSTIQQHWGNSNEEARRDVFTAIRDIETMLKEIGDRINRIVGGELTVNIAGQQVYVKFIELHDDYAVPLPSEPPLTIIIYVFWQFTGNVYEVTFPVEFIGMFPGPQIFAPDSLSAFAFFKRSNTEIISVLTGMQDVPL